MSDRILDASAILVLLNREPGSEKVEALLSGSFVSSVNVAEVAGKLANLDMPALDVQAAIEALGLTVVDFDVPMALEAGMLRKITRKLTCRPRFFFFLEPLQIFSYDHHAMAKGIPFSARIPLKDNHQILKIVVYDLKSGSIGSKFFKRKGKSYSMNAHPIDTPEEIKLKPGAVPPPPGAPFSSQ